MRTVVLGGTGFIGRHLVRELAASGHAVRVFGLPSPDSVEEPSAEYAYGDWSDAGQLKQLLRGGIDCVFHLVGTVDVPWANQQPSADCQLTIAGSLQLFESCVAARVKRVVFVSSGGSVYGEPQKIPISENHPTEPISAHGVSKLAVEKYLKLFHRQYGLEYQIARCSNPYGEGQLPARQGAVAAFLMQALSAQPITIWGDGEVIRDYIYVGDVAQALRRLAEYAGPSAIFNVGSGQAMSLNDLVAAIGKVMGRTLPVRYAPGRSFDVPVNVLDISGIHAALGWWPQVPLDEGLKRTWQWLADYRLALTGPA